jgi:RNA-directed DNA polymerase
MTKSNSEMKIEVWEAIDWAKVERYVFKLQKQIYKASNQGNIKKVRGLQKTLMRSWANRVLAVRRVTQDNRGKKTAGVDGVKDLSPISRIKLVGQLKIKGKSKSTRRVWIPKPGKSEKRPLGIPTMHDRALQGVIKNAIEPEWEAHFEPNSYGFRPGRACQDAIQQIKTTIKIKPKYVLDADIAKCFDKIDHEALLKKLGYCGKVRQQIKAWLKSGVIDNKTFLNTEEGTPQGGVISPLLANIALHGLEKHLKEFAKTIDMKRPNGRQEGWQMKVQSLTFVRYADDFVLFHKDKKVVLEGKKIIEEWLQKIGLKLKPEKTRVAHTLISSESEDKKAGFNFLGYHIQQYTVGKYSSAKDNFGKRLGFRTLITPTKEAYKKHQNKLKETIKNKKIESQADLIGKLNPIIRGWMNYYKNSDIKTVGKTSQQDNSLYQKLRSWGRRRCKASWKNAYLKYWHYVSIKGRTIKRFSTREGSNGLYLISHSDTSCSSTKYVKVKGNASPYDGNLSYWATRMGRHPEIDSLKASLLKKQKGKCTYCDLFFRDKDIQETDHIIARKLNGKNVYANYQLLHGHCHDQKTAEDIKIINAERSLSKTK